MILYFKVIMLLFLILSLFLCGVITTPIETTDNDQRIVGGFDAYPGQFPYQVSIKTALLGGHFCSGSIISNQWILTSGSCTIPVPVRLIRVVVGSIYLNSGGTTHKILFAVKNPDYDPTSYDLTNDIGLMRVNGQIMFSDLVKPVKLSSQASSTGLPFTVSGWGRIHIHNHVYPNTLQFVTLKSIPVRDCKEWFAINLYDTHICTHSNTGLGICMGDFGSALVHNGEQHGIAIYSGLCGNDYPDVYTKVASFRDWIKEISNV